ncbi:MAG: hypothetical protein Tsb0020_34530 [Haliangiales bacterium]
MDQRGSRAPYLLIIPPVAGALAGLARWLLQGTGNVYTNPNKRFYVPDDDLGWRIVAEGPIWLGLEAVGLLFGLVGVAAVGAWLISKREQRQGRRATLGWAVLAVIGLAALAAPTVAFSSGFAPAEGRESPPAGVIGPPTGEIEGSLAGLPAGSYQVVAGAESVIIANVTAGGESFETRFTDNLSGALTFDPSDLSAPLSGSFRVDAASADTGVSMRTKHVRSEDFLHVEKFPELSFTIAKLTSARQGAGPDELVFWADGSVAMMGQTIDVAVEGTARVLDQGAGERFGIDGAAVLVSASFPLRLAETPLSPDDFDEDTIVVQTSLILAAGG